MSWTALIPFKADSDAKSRLAEVLPLGEREAYAAQWRDHVGAVLSSCGSIGEVILLSPNCPPGWGFGWWEDEGLGLNGELERWRSHHRAANLLVIHADLPLVSSAEIEALLGMAERDGAALATDRAGQGSNALALLAGTNVAYKFGEGSRALHSAQRPDMPVILDGGLTFDIDTPADLEHFYAISAGL
jgi:2-phospho-L-lactate/phosphoenolpyruvate guanylyltransferase